MAEVTFTFDTGKVSKARVIDALAVAYGYQEKTPNPENGQMMDNPESKEVFVTNRLGALIADQVFNGERTIAMQKATESVQRIEFKSAETAQETTAKDEE